MSKNEMFKVIILFSATLASVVHSRDIDWAQFDNTVEEFRRLHQIPGLSLTLIDGSETYAKGYGMSDLEIRREMDNGTRVLIASITKSFTALISCRILNEKFPELDEAVLDTPISELVPSYNFTLIDRYRSEKVTFRDLLAHRVCVNSNEIGLTVGAYPTKEDRVYRFRYNKEKCGFRTQNNYSSDMYVLVGEIIAHIAGRPFVDLLTDFMTQLCMHDSLILSADEDYETLPRMSRGYYRNEFNFTSKMNATIYKSNSRAASGGIISTAADMVKYLQFHLNKGVINGTQIMPEYLLDWTSKVSNDPLIPSTPLPVGNYLVDMVFGYGLGLDIGIFGTWSKLGHRGSLPPFASQMTAIPEANLGFFTAINGLGPLPLESDQAVLHVSLAQLVLFGNDTMLNMTNKEKRRMDEMKEAKKTGIGGAKCNPKQDNSSFVGLYGNAVEGDVEFYLGSDGELRLRYGTIGKAHLVPVENEENIYSTVWENEILALFLCYLGGPPLPEFLWDFNIPDKVFYSDIIAGSVEFVRDATIDTYPEIPWAPGSC